MPTNRQSLSEQSKRRTNYILLAVGLILLLLFLLAWCQEKPVEKAPVVEQESIDYKLEPIDGEEENNGALPGFGARGDAQLVVTPPEVVMTPNVVIGSEAEAPLTLRADNAPILLLSKTLADDDPTGFTLSGSCMEKDRLAKDEECILKVLWKPQTLRNISNTLTIKWREDSPSIFNEERTTVSLKAQSTDSKDCIICCEEKEKEKERPVMAVSPNGEIIDPNDPSLERKKDGLLVDKETGVIKGVTEPDKAPLNLKNELMGDIAKNGDVIGKDGKVVGRLLLDNTIIDPNTFVVIGKAVYLTGAMNEHGHVFAKLSRNDNAVAALDANGKVLGFVRVDNQIVDTENKPIGYVRPWGGVVDSLGKFMGVIVSDGSVLDGANKRIAFMRPMGFAVNDKGALVGGMIPHGVSVKVGCESLGEVALNGEVRDSFGQVVGYALLDHSIVDSKMNEIGKVIRQGLVIDASGKALGYVNSAGAAINFKGNRIGCVNPDGTVFANKKFVGAVMPEGQITKGGCSRVGSVYPDSSVVDLSLKKLGYITPEGKAYDDKKQELGQVVPWGTAIAEGCRLLGVIALNGDVVSTDGVKTGCVNLDGTVQNLQGQISGKITPLGPYVDPKTRAAGRVRLDGQIVDNKGDIIGCIYEAQTHRTQQNTQGIVVDENGQPIGRSSIGNKAYDENGNWLGDVYFNGWVIGEKGRLVGVVPFTGTVFSDQGKIVGNYNQMTGLLKNRAGVDLGRVLPGLTVINSAGTMILGKLIPEGTTFIKTDGSLLGRLRSDGQITHNGSVVEGIIHANGNVVDKTGHLIGGAISTGPVLSGAGKYVGLAVENGEVVDSRNIKIGRILPNGLAISDKNIVLGSVFPQLSSALSVDGFVGSVEPKVVGVGVDASYQLQVNDSKGNFVGNVSGTGAILSNSNSVSGRLIPIAPFVNSMGQLIGWASFSGELNNKEGRSIGTILPSGSALGASQDLLGQVVEHLVAVDTLGGYLGHLNSKGEVLSPKGEVVGVVGMTHFLYDAEGNIVGQVLKPGIAVDGSGMPLGWIRQDGQIENGTKVIGQVGLDGHVFNADGQMIGRYLPLGGEVFNDDEKSVGFVSESGEILEANGLSVARMGAGVFAVAKGNIVGRLMDGNRFITSLENGRVLGLADENGSVLPLTSDRSVGKIMMNAQFVDASHQVTGGLVPIGTALTPTLGGIGNEFPDGQIYKSDKKTGITTGTGIVYSGAGELLGGVFAPGVVIDKKGSVVGKSSEGASVVSKEEQIGNRMAFRSTLSTANEWLGNMMLSGGIVNDMGAYQGAVYNDGIVVGPQDVFAGRILPDGSVAGVPERAVLNTMPYIGHTITQGLPVGLNQGFRIVGKTTVLGDVVDDSAKKLFRIIDNAYVVNKAGQKPPVVARVFPFISAVNNDGEVMGIPSANGTVISYQGKINGRVDNAGFIRLNEASSKLDELRIQGLLIPEDLVVNNCKIVGQTAYDGRVINGQGSVVGRIRRDMWAIDANGAEIGRVVRNNEPCIKGKQYVGRSLPDSTVVDINGVEIGCATNSGEMFGPNGEALCKLVPRGVIVDGDGNIIGWARAGGTWTDGEEDKGYLDENGDAFDWNDNWVGHNFGGTTTIFVNENGTVEHAQNEKDEVLNRRGEVEFIVPPTGDPTDPFGNPLGGDLNPYVLGIGYLKGCDLIGFDGQKIASLRADGTFRDDNGDLVYSVTPDGQLYAPNGNPVERFRGLDVSTALKKCGMSGPNNASAGRHITIGNRTITVGPDGTLIDEDGTLIGYLGENGRPVTWDNKPLTSEIDGRKRPITEPIKIPTEKLDEFQEKLAQKRKSMRDSFGKGILTISKEMEARARPKKDKNWGEDRIVSSYPVDMTHVILKGKAIPAVLARSIDSRYANVPAIAIVETNIYAEEGRNILIPAGSRLIGQASSGAGTDKVAKISISWERLIRPDGVAFKLGGAQSGDAQGRGGVAAYLDDQLFKKYGTPVLSSLATTAVSYMLATNDAITSDGSGGYSGEDGRAVALAEGRKNFIGVIQTILDKMIDEAASVPPIVYVPSGTRLTVFPQQDLWLRSADDDEEEINQKYGEPPTSAQVPDTGSWTEKRKKDQEEMEPSSNENTGAENDNQEQTETPLYDGTGDVPDISDRKVDPAIQDEPLF